MRSKQPAQGTLDRHHAVVVGASMTGLLAARVLLDHFEQGTMIECDRLPREAEPHKRVIVFYYINIDARIIEHSTLKDTMCDRQARSTTFSLSAISVYLLFITHQERIFEVASTVCRVFLSCTPTDVQSGRHS